MRSDDDWNRSDASLLESSGTSTWNCPCNSWELSLQFLEKKRRMLAVLTIMTWIASRVSNYLQCTLLQFWRNEKGWWTPNHRVRQYTRAGERLVLPKASFIVGFLESAYINYRRWLFTRIASIHSVVQNLVLCYYKNIFVITFIIHAWPDIQVKDIWNTICKSTGRPWPATLIELAACCECAWDKAIHKL